MKEQGTSQWSMSFTSGFAGGTKLAERNIVVSFFSVFSFFFVNLW